MGRTLFAEATAVVDASVLIDLRKARLHIEFLRLPLKFVIPLAVMEDEALDFTASDWSSMRGRGLEPDAAGDLFAPGPRIAPTRRLSAYDSLLLATARRRNALLLTADAALRRVAERLGVEVHGALWLWDRLNQASAGSTARLRRALEIWREDPTVFLPTAEIEARLVTVRSNDAAAAEHAI